MPMHITEFRAFLDLLYERCLFYIMFKLVYCLTKKEEDTYGTLDNHDFKND